MLPFSTRSNVRLRFFRQTHRFENSSYRILCRSLHVANVNHWESTKNCVHMQLSRFCTYLQVYLPFPISKKSLYGFSKKENSHASNFDSDVKFTFSIADWPAIFQFKAFILMMDWLRLESGKDL